MSSPIDRDNPPRSPDSAAAPRAWSQERYRLLFDTIEQGFCVLEMIFDAAGRAADYRFREINPAFSRHTGISAQDALAGKTARQLYPTLEPFWFETYGRVATSGESAYFENFAEPMGKWFAVHAFRMGGDGGVEVGVLFQDITERRRTDRMIADARLRQDRTLQTAGVATFDWDVQADRVTGNRLLIDYFGINPADAGRLPVAAYFSAIHSDDRARVQEVIDETLSTGRPYEAQYRVTGTAGRERSVLARGDATLAGGRPIRLSGVVLDITDRKRAEAAQRSSAEAVARSEELLRTIFEQAPDDAIIVTDAQRMLTQWNPAAERITGWTAAELIGQPADVIFTPEDRDAGVPARETSTAARDGKAVDERWHVRKDGSRFWGSGTMNSLHARDGTVRGYVKVFRDATARHDEAETLAFLARITDSVSHERSPEQIISVVQRMLGEHLGASRVLFAEASDDGRLVIIRQDWTRDLPSIVGTHRIGDFGRRRENDLLAGQLHVSRDTELDDAAGDGLESLRRLGVRAGISVPVTEDGRLRLVIAVHQSTPRDWTESELWIVRQVADRIVPEIERARAERAVQESEARFRNMADSMPQIVWSARPDGTVDYYNRRWYAYTGLAEGSIGDESWAPVVPEEDVRRTLPRWQESIRSGQTHEQECRYRRADGEYRWHLCRAVPARDSAGNIVRWYGTNTDIHDAKQMLAERERLLLAEREARDEAERQSRMKDEFLATLSHELRTPLNAIVGWTQILKDGSPDDLAEGLEVIDRNARAQTQIIEDILDMSRIIAGKLRLDVQAVDVGELLRSSVETVQPAASGKGVRVTMMIDPSAGPVTGDPNRLQQVFWNVLSNAVKFTPRDGRVRVVLERVHSHVEISVTDTGQGIEASFLPHIFDRFRQADATTTRRHGGLGLGLSIVKQLVEMHGGTVHARSGGPGLGATVAVKLPVTAVHPPAIRPPDALARSRTEPSALTPAPADAALAGVTVLAVDDAPDSPVMLRRLLQECGAVVHVAYSAAEGMATFLKERPMVLISDIGMPGEDGYALLGKIRRLGPDAGGAVPAIALTAYARASDRIRAVEAGFQAHLAKPVDPAELIVTVAAMAKLARQLAE